MPTEQQVKWRSLAGTTVPCHHDKEIAWDEPGVAGRCSDCQDTGRVYLFDNSVRVPCRSESWRESTSNESSPDNHPAWCRGNCKGDNWVPSEDGWVWMAVTSAMIHRGVMPPPFIPASETGTAEELRGNFLKRTLEVVQTIEGVQLGS